MSLAWGIELDFCVDTACTTNFILPQVAYGLDMQVVGAAPAGEGATGAIGGGQEMLLGTAKLGSTGDDGDGVVALTGRDLLHLRTKYAYAHRRCARRTSTSSLFT